MKLRSSSNLKSCMAFILFLFSLSCVNRIFADVPSDYPQQVAFAKQNEGKLQSSINGFDPSKQLPGYNPAPDQEKYQKNPTAIQSDVINQYSTDSGAQAINNQFNIGPKFTIDPTSPGIKQGLFAQQDADDISHGISDEYTDCTPSKNCHTSYTTEECTNSIQRKFNCQKTLNVDVTYDEQGYACNHLDLGNHFSPKILPGPDSQNQCYAGIVMWNSISGRVSQDQPILVPDNVTVQEGIYIYSVPYNPKHSAYTLNGTISANNAMTSIQVNNSNTDKSSQISIGSFTKPSTINVHYDAAYNVEKANGVGNLMVLEYISYPHVPKTNITETWSNSCANDNALSGCQTLPQTCTEPGATRNINGKDISEPCWQYSTSYICGVNNNDCQAYQGCEQTGSDCQTQIGGVCIQYKQTYQCETQHCDTTGMVCGGQFFCIDGDCSDPKPTQNQDIGKDSAELAAVAGGISQLKDNPNVATAFTGQAMSCSMAPLGFLNCCQDDGWGKDIGLAKCTNEEQKLGEAKQKGLVIKPDDAEYCANKVAGICLESRKGYCVFPSKLAVDVQQGGAKDQLGKSFGNGKDPNCAGINLQDLQRIDFSKIDFTNVADDMKNQAQKNMPDPNAVNNSIQQHIQQQIGKLS